MGTIHHQGLRRPLFYPVELYLLMNNCLNCNTKTSNPRFCSQSCSAIYNNKLNPKRKKEGVCKNCGAVIRSAWAYCENCTGRRTTRQIDDLTLKEAIYNEHHRSSAFALVRTRARAALKSLGKTSCEKCGYSKHIECCHIKPISSFPDTIKLSQINDPTNLLALCPNCHWEYDHPSG